MKEIRVIYDNTTKQIKFVFEGGTYKTDTLYSAIQDSADNCKAALTAIGISDLSKIDEYINNLK